MRSVLVICAALALGGCGERVIHSQVAKPNVTIEEARKDLAGCKLEGQKAAGRPPMDESLLSLEAWNVHRSQTAALCLESKGYEVRLNLPGRCTGQCVGPTEVLP